METIGSSDLRNQDELEEKVTANEVEEADRASRTNRQVCIDFSVLTMDSPMKSALLSSGSGWDANPRKTALGSTQVQALDCLNPKWAYRICVCDFYFI